MWNEAHRVEATVERLAGSPLHGDHVELVFVDDGSGDDTLDLLHAALKRCGLHAVVLSLDRNEGKGAAVRAGLLAATGQVVGFVDADLPVDTEDVEAVFGRVASGAQVALASRVAPGTVITVRQPLLRRWSGYAFNRLLRSAGLSGRRDTQCGLKAFDHRVVPELFRPLRCPGFGFDVEVLQRAERAGLVIEEVPVRWRHVEGGRVRFRDGLRTWVEVWRLRRPA